MRILLLDIETSPLIGYSWGTYDTDIIEVIKDFEILCWTGKILGEKKIYQGSMQGKKSDKSCVEELHKLLDTIDVVVAHNGDKFDTKKINARFIFYGLPPSQPYKTVDTLKEIKKIASFTSNKLDNLGELLGEGRKLKTDFSLWKGCMDNDPKAFKRMLDYNKEDVLLLEKIYLRILPYMKSHPNWGIYENDICCPKCGSKHLQSRGYALNKSTRYRRFQCQSCGSWLRGSANEQKVKVNQLI